MALRCSQKVRFDLVSRSAKQIVLDEYLMHQINEVTEEQDADKAAFDACLIIAFAGDEIDEFHLGLYLSPVQIDKQTVIHALQFFAGMGFLKIICYHDSYEGCLAQTVMDNTSEHFQFGKLEAENKSDIFQLVKSRIEGFQKEFWGGTW